MKYINIIWGLCLVAHVQGQQMDFRIAPVKKALSEVEVLKMPEVDNKALMEAELQRRHPGVAPRFAKVFAVDVKTTTHGNWEYLDDGRAVWRLRILSSGAYSLNLGFTNYQMPEGGSLILYSPDLQRVRGPFTPADNEEHIQLWTPVLDGDQLVIEVQLPKEKIPELGLHLSTVNHDFMGFSQMASGNCNLDVLCGAAEGYEFVEAYRDQIQSVAIYGLQGNLFCTGFLVNNTRKDCTPFFMTAAHCEVTANEAASLVVYWNYENSTCRELGSAANGRPGDGKLNDFNTGAILRASYNPSDMALLELDDPVSSTAEAYFAGWTREAVAPQNGVASIHHPNADEKSISYSTRKTYLGTWAGGADEIPNGNHIVVPQWSIGTTETGSSGGPLFNEAGLVVGQLHGGIADCAGGGYDTFGWFAVSWEGGGTPSTSLRRWLDPDNTGVMTLSGRSQRSCSYYVEAAIPGQAVCAPDEAVYTLQVSEVFTGPVSLTITGLPQGLEAVLGEGVIAPGGNTELRIRGTDQVNSNTYTFTVTGTDGAESASTQLELNIFRTPPDIVNLLEPANGSVEQSIRAGFSWAGEPFATRYEFVLATDSGFTNIVASVSDLGTTQLTNFELAALTQYYWRVRGRNLCGWGDWSVVRSFTTAGVGCAEVQSTDVPIDISGKINTINSSINITAPGIVEHIRLTGVNITHTFVGDLRVSLISPQGTQVILFDRPGLPQTFFGCDGDNLLLDFSDDAVNSAADLENTCNSLPAIQGSFQPQRPLANFKGESVTGIWTLRVEDLVPEDAGRLNSWGLDFCTSIPQEKQLYTITDQYKACAEQPVDFSLLVGTAFSEPVEISASGLPPEATLTYSKNPASPGTSVNVQINGLTDGGIYELILSADTVKAGVQIEIIGLPEAVLPLEPQEASVVNPEKVMLRWHASSEANFYQLDIFEGELTGTPFLSVELVDTFYTLQDLDFGKYYYWRVIPQNICGGKTSENFQSFFTRPNISLKATPLILRLCPVETGTVEISVGPGFADPAQITYRINPQDTILVNYNINPEQVTPGGVVRAKLADLHYLEPGVYALTFYVQDSIYVDSTSVTLQIINPPAVPGLLAPENNGDLSSPLPVFQWTKITGADRYRLEIATDPNFSLITQRIETSVNEWQLLQALDPGVYYWRVTTINRCGGATSAAFRFELQTTGITEWTEGIIRWYPNPTKGEGYLQFSQPLGNRVTYHLFSSAGVRMMVGEIAKGSEQISLNLEGYPPGIYLLRLTRADEAAILKIIKQ